MSTAPTVSHCFPVPNRLQYKCLHHVPIVEPISANKTANDDTAMNINKKLINKFKFDLEKQNSCRKIMQRRR